MTNLAAMNERMQGWMSEKQSAFSDNSHELKLNDGDMPIFHFASSGNDGDRLFFGYRSHIFPMVGKRGGRYNETRYCMVQNGEGQECAFCAQGHTDIKERMSMWLLVQGILHTYLPQPRQGQQPVAPPNWPLVPHEGRNWYYEEVNAWKVWHNSAWRDSPWSDIITSNARHQGLHSMQYEMMTTGTGMQRRYKLIELAGVSPPMNPEFYRQAWETLTPIKDMLFAEAARPVAINPQQQQPQGFPQQQPGGFAGFPQQQAWAPPTAAAPGAIPFTPFSTAAVAPPLAVPSALPTAPAAPPPLATAPVPAPQVFQPASAPPAGLPILPGAATGPSQVPVATEAPAPPQAAAAPPTPVTPPASVMPPAAPPAPPAGPSVPPQAPAMPAAPPAAPSAVQQAPDDGRQPVRRMF